MWQHINISTGVSNLTLSALLGENEPQLSAHTFPLSPLCIILCLLTNKVNQDALDQARRMSEERRASLQTQPAAAAAAASGTKKTVKAATSAGYEFVDIPGKKLNAVSE
jgi:hypothetical protein